MMKIPVPSHDLLSQYGTKPKDYLCWCGCLTKTIYTSTRFHGGNIGYFCPECGLYVGGYQVNKGYWLGIYQYEQNHYWKGQWWGEW